MREYTKVPKSFKCRIPQSIPIIPKIRAFDLRFRVLLSLSDPVVSEESYSLSRRKPLTSSGKPSPPRCYSPCPPTNAFSHSNPPSEFQVKIAQKSVSFCHRQKGHWKDVLLEEAERAVERSESGWIPPLSPSLTKVEDVSPSESGSGGELFCGFERGGQRG